MNYCPICGSPVTLGQKTVKENGIKVHLKCKANPSIPHQSQSADSFAGFWDRLGSRLIDGFIIAIPLGILGTVLNQVLKTNILEYTLISFVDVDFILTTIYWVFVAWMIGTSTQSIGMKTRKIKLVSLGDEKAGFIRVYIRDWFNTLTLGLGNLCILFHPERKSVADIIFKTKVTY